MDDESCRNCDDHSGATCDDRVVGFGDDGESEEGRETDPDLAERLATREADLEEQRFALADLEAERW